MLGGLSNFLKRATAWTASNLLVKTGSDGVSVVETGVSVDASDNVSGVADLSMSGNFTVGGTVDGRDVATDGTKLDGIESGATADQTGAEMVTAIGGVLEDLNTLGAASSDGEVIVSTGVGAFAYESGATLRTSIGVGTGDSPQFTGIELGHASDTTLTRSAAGTLAVEGVDVVTLTAAQVLTNKTLTAPQINDTSADHQYIFGVSELTADRTVTLPLLTGNDTFTFNDFAATLTNKTVDLDSNTLTGTVAEFNTALQSATFGTFASTMTDHALPRADSTGGALQDSTVIVSDSGEMTNASQPAFSADNTGTDSNVTGDGTAVTVEFNSENFDQGGDYDEGTDTFTAPVTGKYMLCAHVTWNDAVAATHTFAELRMVTSNRTFDTRIRDASYMPDENTMTIFLLADMDASDTAYVQFEMTGGTAVVDIFGGLNITAFSGYLVA